MNILGKLITLRAIEEEDLPQLHVWANDLDICQMIGGWHFPTAMKDQKKWYESLGVHSLHQRFAIENESRVLIGTANLVNINWKDRNAEHGMLIGNTENRGKGYAQDVIFAIMRYAFEELGLNRLDTTIIEYNLPSIKVYTEKCGWKIEGRQQQWYYRRGRYWDRIFVGIIRSDYERIEK